MSNRKKIFSLLVLLIFLVTLFCGCSNTQDMGQSDTDTTKEEGTAQQNKLSGTVKVSVVGWQLDDGIDPLTGNNIKGFNTLVKEVFNKKYPDVKVDISTIPWESAKAKQQTMLMSNDVDVLYSAGSYTAAYSQQDLLYHIDDLIEKDKSFDPGLYPKGIWDFHISTWTLDKQHRIGLPFALGKRVAEYDKQIFDNWGVEYLSEYPTPEEILEKAKKMTGINPKTGKQNYGIWTSAKDTNLIIFMTTALYNNAMIAEGDLNDFANLKWKLNSPEMIETLEYVGEICKYAPAAFATGAGSEKWETTDNDIAIILGGSGTKPMIEYRTKGDTSLIERFVPVMMPGPNGGTMVPCDPIIMAKNTKNPELSWEVMKFMASKDALLWYYTEVNGCPALADTSLFDENDPYTKVAVEISKNAILSHQDFNPFFQSDVTPFIMGYMVDCATGKNVDLKAELDKLQEKAKKWSETYKK